MLKLIAVALDYRLDIEMRRLPEQINVGVAALRPQQGDRFVEQIGQNARRATKVGSAAEIEKALEMHLHERQLPQRHVQSLGIGLAVHLTGVQLNREPGA